MWAELLQKHKPIFLMNGLTFGEMSQLKTSEFCYNFPNYFLERVICCCLLWVSNLWNKDQNSNVVVITCFYVIIFRTHKALLEYYYSLLASSVQKEPFFPSGFLFLNQIFILIIYTRPENKIRMGIPPSKVGRFLR